MKYIGTFYIGGFVIFFILTKNSVPIDSSNKSCIFDKKSPMFLSTKKSYPWV